MRVKRDRVYVKPVELSYEDRRKIVSFYEIFAQIAKRVDAKEGKKRKIKLKSKSEGKKGSLIAQWHDEPFCNSSLFFLRN